MGNPGLQLSNIRVAHRGEKRFTRTDAPAGIPSCSIQWAEATGQRNRGLQRATVTDSPLETVGVLLANTPEALELGQCRELRSAE